MKSVVLLALVVMLVAAVHCQMTTTKSSISGTPIRDTAGSMPSKPGISTSGHTAPTTASHMVTPSSAVGTSAKPQASTMPSVPSSTSKGTGAAAGPTTAAPETTTKKGAAAAPVVSILLLVSSVFIVAA